MIDFDDFVGFWYSWLAARLPVGVRSDLRRPLRRIFLSSLHGPLISLRGLKKITAGSKFMDCKIGKDVKIGIAQLSMNEFLLAVTFLDLK